MSAPRSASLIEQGRRTFPVERTIDGSSGLRTLWMRGVPHPDHFCEPQAATR